MKIKTKLQIASILSIVTVLLIGCLLYYERQQDEEITAKSMMSERLVKDVFETNILIYDSILHQRDVRKRAYTQWQLKYNSLSKRLAGLKSKDSKEQALLNDLTDNLNGINAIFLEINKIDDSGGSLGETEENLVSQVLVKSQTVVSIASQFYDTNYKTLVAVHSKTHILILSSIIFLTLFIITASFFVNKGITKPIGEIVKGLQVLGTGNLDCKLGFTGNSEISQIANTFDLMTLQLKETTVSRDKLLAEMEERIRTERELQKSRDRFVRLSEATSEGVVISEEGHILDINKQMEIIFGYKIEELKGKIAIDLVIPKERERVKNMISSHYEERYETIGLRKDGTPVDLSIHGKTLIFEDSRMRITSVRDITEYKLKEKALTREKQEWKKTFDTIPDLMMILDNNHKIIKMNETIAKRLNLTPEEAIGRPCYELLYAADKPLENCPHKLLLEDGLEHKIELHNIHLGGDFLVTTTPLRNTDGTIYGSVHIARDITAERMAKEALKSSEEKYRTLMDKAGDGIVLIDFNGYFLEVNKKIEELLRYTRDEMLMMHFTDIHPQEEIEKVKKAFERGIGGTAGVLLNTHIKAKDGVIIPIEIRGSVVEYGGIKVAQGMFRDISERVKYEQTIREAYERLTIILDSVEAVVYVADMDTYEIIFANSYVKEAFNNDIITGKKCWQTFQDDQNGPCSFCTNNKLLDANSNPLGVYKWEHKNTANNRWYYMQDRAIRWVDGRIVRLEFATDITERKELELLLAQEHSFRKAIESCILAGMAATDNEGRQIYVNPSFCMMVGWSQAELIGALPPHIYWAPEDYDNIGAAMKDTIEGTAPAEGFDVLFRKRTGERFNVNILVSPLIDARGVRTGWLASVYDISERKRLEEQLKTKTDVLGQLNTRLEGLVSNKLEEIRQKEQLLIQQSKMAAMGEMIGMIAHQWKQPLNAISLFVADIEDAYDFGELDKEYLSESVNKTVAQIGFLAKTIDDFRNFFKTSKVKVLFNVLTSLNDILDMFEGLFKRNDITINIKSSCTDDVPLTLGYPNEFKQVILNLLNNSRDAIISMRDTHKGERHVGGIIDIYISKEGQRIIITVSDNGGGIPGEVIARVFDPYFTTKSEEKGTGIGLYMSKSIIEKNMGGKLTVRNTDIGAEFMIELEGCQGN
ncbi:MAG: PAS domain S-box protein [Nitrospirae bacterium]|nr:PAS domain S-box protein [Nitrospirota bacterium]